MFPKFLCAYGLLGELVKMQIQFSVNGVCGLRFCISNKLTSDIPEAGPHCTISKVFSVVNYSVEVCLHSVVEYYSAGKRVSSFGFESESE